MSSAVIGSLRIALGLDSAQFDAGVSKVERGSQRAAASMQRMGAAGGRVDFRGLGQQLSQVAQSSLATGDVLRSLAIQLPDIGLLFGGLGTAAGLAAGLLLPLASNLFGLGGAAKDTEGKTRTLTDAVSTYIDFARRAQLPTAELAAKYGLATDAARTFNEALRQIGAVEAGATITSTLDDLANKLGAFGGDVGFGKNLASQIDQLQTLITSTRDAADATYDLTTSQRLMAQATGYEDQLSSLLAYQSGVENLRYTFNLGEKDATLLGSALNALGRAQGLTNQIGAAENLSSLLLGIYGTVEAMPDPLRDVYKGVNESAEKMAEMQGATVRAGFAVTELATAARGISPALGGALGVADALAAKLWNAAGAALAVAQNAAGARAAALLGDDERGSQRQGSLSVSAYRAATALQVATRRASEYHRALTQVGRAAGGAGGGGGGGASSALQTMQDRVREATQAIIDGGQASIQWAETLQGTFSDAIDSAVSWMVNGFRGGFESLVQIGVDAFKQIASYWLKNKLTTSLSIAGIGAGGPALAGTPGGSGIMGGIGAAIGGIGSGLWAGASGVLGGLASGGLAGAGAALSNIVSTGTALTGITGSLGGLAAAAGAIAVPLAAAAAAFSFFRKRVKEVDQLLAADLTAKNQAFWDVRMTQTSRFWGLSKSSGSQWNMIGGKAGRDLAKPFDDLIGNIREMGKALHITGVDFSDWSYKIRRSVKGLTDDQKAQVLAEELGKAGDSLARFMGVGRRYTQEGETATAALQRLVTSLKGANGAFKLLGFALFDVSLKGAAAASRFVEAFGGLDKFAQATSFYFDNFLSLPERVKALTRQFTDAFRDLGINGPVPQSIEAFKALVDRLMAAGKNGKGAGLIQLADEFKAILDLREELNPAKPVDTVIRRALNPNDFRTQLDYFRAASRGSNGAATDAVAKVVGKKPALSAEDKETLQIMRTMRDELRDNRQLLKNISAATQKTATINSRWDEDGVPIED